MGDDVALARRAANVAIDGALTVEVRRHVAPVEIGEDRRERFTTVDQVGRLGSVAAHVDREAHVDGHGALRRSASRLCSARNASKRSRMASRPAAAAGLRPLRTAMLHSLARLGQYTPILAPASNYRTLWSTPGWWTASPGSRN